jgi:heme exporter protein D
MSSARRPRNQAQAMPDLGPHAAFIWAAYGITFVAVAVLVLAIVSDDRRQRRLLADLEQRGITRRSAKAAAIAASPAAAKSPAATKPPAGAKPKAPRARAARPRKPKP